MLLPGYVRPGDGRGDGTVPPDVVDQPPGGEGSGTTAPQTLRRLRRRHGATLPRRVHAFGSARPRADAQCEDLPPPGPRTASHKFPVSSL